jgi:hypothetical protein
MNLPVLSNQVEAIFLIGESWFESEWDISLKDSKSLRADAMTRSFGVFESSELSFFSIEGGSHCVLLSRS